MEPTRTDQSLLEHLQPSVIVLLFRLLSAIFLLDTIYGLFILGFFGLGNVHAWHSTYVGFLWLLQFAKYLLITAIAIKVFALLAGRAYYLSGHHLIERLGIVNITETTYELSQVKSVIVHQSWLGRRFNYGTIKLSFAGSNQQQEIILRDIGSPMKYKAHFDQHLQVQGWVR